MEGPLNVAIKNMNQWSAKLSDLLAASVTAFTYFKSPLHAKNLNEES